MSNIIKALSERPIAYFPIYRKITGSTTAGILLSQLMFWFKKKDKMFKTDHDIREETMLTENELRSAKKIIKSLDFITITREGIPAKTYYEICYEKLEKALKQHARTSSVKSTELASLNSLNCSSEINETINDISLTKTTTKTTTKRESKEKPLPSSFSSEDLKTSEKLFAYLKQIHPSIKQPDFHEWSKHVYAMRVTDAKSTEGIETLMFYIFEDNDEYTDTFWRSVVTDTKKLRDNYDKIAVQVRSGHSAVRRHA